MNEAIISINSQSNDNIVAKSQKSNIAEIVLAILALIFLVFFIIFLCLYIHEKNKDKSYDTTLEQNFKLSQDQFIPAKENINDGEGAYELRGTFDKTNSKYFKSFDIYNTKSSGSLILLEKFKTYQQTSSYSCGCASLIMAIHYLDGTIIGEEDCSKKAKSVPINGTLPENLEIAIREYGYDYESKRKGFDNDEVPSYDEFKFSEYLKNSLKQNESVIILSNDWGGHFTVVIGYDDMGTDDIEDDVVIIADPFDTSDHIDDGYTIWSYERLYYQMEIEVFGIPGNNYDFIKVKRKSS
jgi:preprotein translocase subunit SecG